MMKKFEQTLLGSKNTIKTQKSLYERHLRPYLPKDYHDDLLLELFDLWTGDDLGPGTIRGLTSLFKKYCRWKWRVEPDCSGIRYAVRALPQETKVKAWTKEEAGQALATAEVEDPELYPMLLTTLHTGIRKGEMQALMWGDVDFISSKILIRRSKNGKPRTVPLTEQLEKVLMNCYTIGEEDEHCFPKHDPNDRL
ncbi:MAG: tyrosine-type recombinase/integrase, partial [Candidatus Thorarchaeota archaeon]